MFHFAVGRVCRFAMVLALLEIVPCGVSSARGDDGEPVDVAALQRRVEDLDAVVRQMQAERSANPPAAVAPLPALDGTGQPAVPFEGPIATPASVSAINSIQTPGPGPAAPKTEAAGLPTAGWDKAFYLQAPDKSFVLHLTGQLQLDYRDYLDRPDTTDIDTFLVRRARLGIEATMLNYYEFRLLPDFGGTSPTVTDAYVNVHYWDEFQFETGKFKQPFSYEQLIQDRYVPTMERSMIDQMVPARDVGAMLWGRSLLNDRLDWGIAVSNGEINGNTDTNDDKDINGRVAIRPFNDPDLWAATRRLGFGISAGWGVEDEPINPLTLKTPATVPWFAYNSTVRADGARSRISPELVYFYHSLGFAAQYYHQEQELQPSSSSRVLVDVPTDGFYFTTTYLLTGEERTDYTQQIAPLRPFDPGLPFVSPGAWELVYRISRLDVPTSVFNAGAANLADPTKYSSGATESTVGVNWYWNKWVRAQLNWEHAWFDDRVALGTGSNPYLKHQDTVYTRFQFIF